MALVSLAAGVLALAAFLLVVLRERGLRSRRLVWSEAAAVLGGVAAVLVMQRVTHSGFGDIGGPIDWVVGIAIFAAGGLGALVATYAALGVARRLADTASPGDTAGPVRGKGRRAGGSGVGRMGWQRGEADAGAARIPDRRHECLRTPRMPGRRPPACPASRIEAVRLRGLGTGSEAHAPASYQRPNSSTAGMAFSCPRTRAQTSVCLARRTSGGPPSRPRHEPETRAVGKPVRGGNRCRPHRGSAAEPHSRPRHPQVPPAFRFIMPASLSADPVWAPGFARSRPTSPARRYRSPCR